MKFLSNMIAGFFIGIGGLAPGSGGALFAMIIGIYEKMLDAIGNFFKDPKKNLLFLLPIALGAVIGIIIFSKLLNFLITNYPVQTMFSFAGLIIGTFPILFKKANKGHFNKKYLIPLFIAIFISLFISSFFDTNVMSETVEITMSVGMFLYLIFAGFALSGSLIIPGMNGTLLMIILGIYTEMLEILSDIPKVFLIFSSSQIRSEVFNDFAIIIPMLIGMAIGAIVFSKLLNFLFQKSYSMTYYAVLGFIIGCIPSLIPSFSFDTTGLISIILFMVFLYLSGLLDKLENGSKS